MGTGASGCNLAAVLPAIDRLRSAEGVDDFEVDEGPAGRRGGASFSTASMLRADATHSWAAWIHARG